MEPEENQQGGEQTVHLDIESVRQLIHVFSHDLRNPLLNVRALVQEVESMMLRAKDAQALGKQEDLSLILGEELPEALDMLQSSANRMDDMVLGVNEIYHCMFDELELEDVDMHAMFLRCFALLKLADEGIQIICPAMPKVRADHLMVQRVVGEILSNAKKATCRPNHDYLKAIHIKSSTEGDFVHFCVEDYGCGFDKNELEHVFAPFFSGQAFTYGIGMGLTRVKAWIEHHGGVVSVNTDGGKTLVCFSLPAA